MVDQDSRDRPKPYIDKALQLLFENKKETSFDIDIVEIGCMRAPLTHHVDITTNPCCNDGHSTYLFARTGYKVISVDIDENHVNAAKESCKLFSNVKHINMDAMDFARSFVSSNPAQTIGLLFLDAWDLELACSAQSHLDFYEILKPVLNNDCMILIDDTDLWYDQEAKEYFSSTMPLVGKGQKLIPELCRNGYEITFHGRQTLLCK